jgi:hypothetical protein
MLFIIIDKFYESNTELGGEKTMTFRHGENQFAINFIYGFQAIYSSIILPLKGDLTGDQSFKKGGQYGKEISEKGTDWAQHRQSGDRHRWTCYRSRRVKRRAKGCR